MLSSEALARGTPSPSFLLMLLLLLLTCLILHACAPHHERNVRALANARDQVTFFPPFLPPSFSTLRPVVGCTIRAVRAAALPPEGRKGEETSGAAAAGLCPPPTLPAAAAAENELSGEEGRQDKGAKPKAVVAVAVGH